MRAEPDRVAGPGRATSSRRGRRRVGVGLACLVLIVSGFALASRSSLEMQPATISACKSTATAVTVHWRVPRWRAQSVKLDVANLAQEPKLWTQGGAAGSATTGPWAHDGFTVTARAPDGTVLARQTLTSTACVPSG